jgi:predicted GH43/DUF377 family glycosyl hydrolase
MPVAQIPRRLALVFFLAPFFLAAQSGSFPFELWHRVSDSPIISPQGTSWESAGTFNPAVVLVQEKVPNKTASPSGSGSKVVMLYRAQDASGTSRLGYAESLDGIHFARRAEPVLSPEGDYEKGGGVENGSLFCSQPTCQHAPEVYGGIAAGEASKLLREFTSERERRHVLWPAILDGGFRP